MTKREERNIARITATLTQLIITTMRRLEADDDIAQEVLDVVSQQMCAFGNSMDISPKMYREEMDRIYNMLTCGEDSYDNYLGENRAEA